MSRASRNGFTLVEVLVATAVLVTVAAGTTQLFAIAIRHTVAARQQLAMSALANAKLDEIVAAIAAAPPPAAASGALDRDVAGFSDLSVMAGASFRRRWLIAPLPAYGATAVAIVVRVVPLASRAAPELEIAALGEAGGA